MGSSRRDLRSGAHLCSVCCRSTTVNAGQRRSKSVNAGQSWSMPVNAGQLSPNFGRSPFRPIFDGPDMFTTSDLRYEISKVKNGD
ncbi:hypothetical protein TIFTF001_052520 [Ficus carica]|uniref:Uncharacterized protein n=1 Tax=Ficus carica TaxID=3494 RepID=A0AA88EHH1_FICCA|nr:hypothetical protein TIFTF001_052520 [Ficus carica]